MASHSVKNAPDLALAVGGDDGHLTHFHLKSLCHLLLSDVEKRGKSYIFRVLVSGALGYRLKFFGYR